MLQPGYQLKFDAAESAFTLAALSYIESYVYELVLPPMEGRQYVEVDNSAPPGALSTRYRMFTRVGAAQFITDDTDDLPASSLFVREIPHDFQAIGSHYQYSYWDLLAAAMAAQNGGPPVNLDMELGIASREAIERKLDRISAFGSTDTNDPVVGLVGLLNLPNVTLYVLATGIGGSITWASKTPDEIIADMTGIIAALVAGTYKAFQPTNMLLPILQHQTIAGRSMGDGRSDTILSYFMRTRAESKQPIAVDSWQHCTNAGAGGAIDRMVVYNKNKRYVRHMVSMEYTQLPAERRGLKYRVDCLARTAGVICPYPASASYADGL